MTFPDLVNIPSSSGQTDKSFKGTGPSFVPPSPTERSDSILGKNFELEEEFEDTGGVEETDRDELPLLTKQELDEFLTDNIDTIETDRLNVSNLDIIDNTTDPISSIVEEIVKNETIIGDDESFPTTESSMIKFNDRNVKQLLDAQNIAVEDDNQTISNTNEEPPLNVTQNDFEIEQGDKISESTSPDVNVQSFINETANEDTTSAGNDTATTTTEDETGEGKPTGLQDILQTDTDTEDKEQTTTTEQSEEGEENVIDEDTTSAGNDTATTTTEDETGEGKPTGLQDILQTDTDTEDKEQTTPVEKSNNNPPIAQDVSITTQQNEPATIILDAKDSDGDSLTYTIVDNPSNGKVGNVNVSTKTITYTPDEDYSGEDIFTYLVNDGNTDSNEATISITIKEQETEQFEEDQEKDDNSQTTEEDEGTEQSEVNGEEDEEEDEG